MMKNLKSTKEIIESIRVIYGFKTLSDVSIYFGKQRNWATQMIKKGSIPYPQCIQTCNEQGASMDFILYGVNSPIFDKRIILQQVVDSLFESVELGILPEINKDKLTSTALIVMKGLEESIYSEKKNQPEKIY
ncbi:hypothetical protein [Pseudoalteromonas piscicida]|uniref:hypothetical protein n=1 Tax=Pseudoalteromonas piscicida TaxID=43662 RepID=UPI0005FA73E0|nr:hypothetical protein [Pseudoalteromonas piscicida]KJZ02855.1 hypothetical protein TW73_10760 [Pseudoalteromonas piscicida]